VEYNHLIKLNRVTSVSGKAAILLLLSDGARKQYERSTVTAGETVQSPRVGNGSYLNLLACLGKETTGADLADVVLKTYNAFYNKKLLIMNREMLKRNGRLYMFIVVHLTLFIKPYEAISRWCLAQPHTMGLVVHIDIVPRVASIKQPASWEHVLPLSKRFKEKAEIRPKVWYQRWNG